MIWKLIYCTLWSVGLFVATFYGLFNVDQAFDFTGSSLLSTAQSYIMPMIMVMTLYLFDVLYEISTHRHCAMNTILWILLTLIVFMLSFVFSILVNRNALGWALFILSWASLTVLKFQTTGEGISPYQIMED